MMLSRTCALAPASTLRAAQTCSSPPCLIRFSGRRRRLRTLAGGSRITTKRTYRTRAGTHAASRRTLGRIGVAVAHVRPGRSWALALRPALYCRRRSRTRATYCLTRRRRCRGRRSGGGATCSLISCKDRRVGAAGLAGAASHTVPDDVVQRGGATCKNPCRGRRGGRRERRGRTRPLASGSTRGNIIRCDVHNGVPRRAGVGASRGGTQRRGRRRADRCATSSAEGVAAASVATGCFETGAQRRRQRVAGRRHREGRWRCGGATCSSDVCRDRLIDDVGLAAAAAAADEAARAGCGGSTRRVPCGGRRGGRRENRGLLRLLASGSTGGIVVLGAMRGAHRGAIRRTNGGVRGGWPGRGRSHTGQCSSGSTEGVAAPSPSASPSPCCSTGSLEAVLVGERAPAAEAERASSRSKTTAGQSFSSKAYVAGPGQSAAGGVAGSSTASVPASPSASGDRFAASAASSRAGREAACPRG